MQPGPRVPTEVERYARRFRAGAARRAIGDRGAVPVGELAIGGRSAWQALLAATVRG